MFHRWSCFWLLSAICHIAAPMYAHDAVSPRSVKVLPVFLVPKGQSAPSDEQSEKLIRHLTWSQTRYRQLLSNEVTFSIADDKPRLYHSEHELAFYRSLPESGAPQMVSELLKELNITRYSCPYIFLVLVMNPDDDFPIGGGRPLNGGVNTGGGVVQLSSFALDRLPNFQSTLQHELGHAFGLPHVNVYGYDMQSSDSIMSYNPSHHTNEFAASATPGKLIPEDLRALALNQRVFPELTFDQSRDVLPQYSLAKDIVPFGPMTIPGQPDGVKFTTAAGEEFASKISNLTRRWIRPNRKDGSVSYDPSTMWHSSKVNAEWLSVGVEFPYDVELTKLAFYSQHSGMYHVARGVRVAVRDSQQHFEPVAAADLQSADAILELPKTQGRIWRLDFRAGDSGYVVLRGIRFFSGDDELFPPLIPYSP